MFGPELNGRSLAKVAVGLYPVVRTVYASRPDLSFRSRAVVEAVFLSGGSIGTAQQVAPHLGLHNRFELARFLKREGLPPLHDLAAWASVLAWVVDRFVARCCGTDADASRPSEPRSRLRPGPLP